MSEAALLAALSSDSNVVQEAVVEPAAPQPAAAQSEAQSLLSALGTPAQPPSPTKRRASLEPEVPDAKRIKVEPADETRLPTSDPLDTAMPTTTDALMTPAVPATSPPAAAPAPSDEPMTAASDTQLDIAMTSAITAPPASAAPTPQMASSAPSHPTGHVPTPTPTTAAVAAATDSPATPIPSIEKSPSIKLEPSKKTATPDSAKDNATPEAPPVVPEAPPPAAAAPPRKRRRMLEAPGQALRGMNMQLLGIQAVQVLEWLSQEPFEDVIDALRDVESEVYASYSFKVAQFEQAWRNFSMTEDLLEWSKMGLGDQKHRKTVRLANLARFAIDLFSEDETCLPSLHERFFRVFVYGTRKFNVDHSNILLELKTQLALHLLEEGGKDKAPADLLQEVFMDGLEAKLKGRSWYPEKFEEEAAMLTSAEIRMSLLLQEYEESGSNTATLAARYPYDSLLKQLGSYMHTELVAHSDHCQTLVFSSRTAGKRPTENRSLAYQDDDDYWQRTNKLIDDLAASIVADMGSQEPSKDSSTGPAPATSNGPVPDSNAQATATSNGTAKNEPAATATAASTSAPVELGEQLRSGIDQLKEFANQKVAAREAEMARASPPTPLAPAAPIDQTVQNLYLLNKATQSQQPVYTPRGSATPQTQPPTPTGGPHLPIQGHPQGHMPHISRPASGVPNQTPEAGQPSQPLAPGELPPNQTCPTSMLYDKARQAALSKSATHTRREGIHSTRRPWTPEEEKALMTGLDMVKGPHWSQILSLFGPNGTISDVLKDRTQVQLKDKARNLKLFFLKTQSEMPYYLSAVTGELKTRAPNQAARKEAEERARLSREGDQTKTQGSMAALVGQLQSATQAAQAAQGSPGDLARQQHNPPQQQPSQAQQQPQHQPQPQHQHTHARVVTPAQAALAAHITTPAMAQGQAQSAQRPIAAQPLPAALPAKEVQTAAPVSAPTVAPSPAPAQGGAGSAPVAQSQSQPHNRPSDGTVAALQELAKASATPAVTPAPRVQSQAVAQGQAQTQARATPSAPPNQGQTQAQTQSQPQPQVQTQAQPAPQPQPQPQAPAQPQQTQAQAQARVSGSPGVSARTPTPATTTPAAPAAKTTATPSPAPAPQEQPAAPTGPASTPATATKTPQAPPTTSSKAPTPIAAPSASSTAPTGSALAQLQNSRSTPVTLSQSFPSTIPANLFSRVTEAEATNAGLLEKLRAEMAREARS